MKEGLGKEKETLDTTTQTLSTHMRHALFHMVDGFHGEISHLCLHVSENPLEVLLLHLLLLNGVCHPPQVLRGVQLMEVGGELLTERG